LRLVVAFGASIDFHGGKHQNEGYASRNLYQCGGYSSFSGNGGPTSKTNGGKDSGIRINDGRN